MLIKKLRRVLIAALALLSVMPAAQPANVGFTGTLVLVYPMADGTVALGFTASVPVCNSAGPVRYMYLATGQNGMSADGFKNMYAAALTAFAAEKTVDIIYDDSSNYCYVNRLLIR